MSVDMGVLVKRIPQDKLNEIVESFTEGTTVQEVLDSLRAAGVEATEEEAQALAESLLLKDEERALSDEELKEVAGGEEDHDGDGWRKIHTVGGDVWVWYSCPYCRM